VAGLVGVGPLTAVAGGGVAAVQRPHLPRMATGEVRATMALTEPSGVAGRALRVGRAAFEDALAYAQERASSGKPIWQHQSVGNYLADMATFLTAARQLTLYAAQNAAGWT
jgi:alkylation response protein AidB-like acyl-CoA dehydrogenase